MIDHICIYSHPETFDATVKFYTAFLKPLGYFVKMTIANGMVVAFSSSEKHADYWIANTALHTDKVVPGYAHFAFSAADREIVDQCFKAGVEAGGKDNGPPGLRPQYSDSYYGGFLLDPTGNCTEAVFRED